MVSFYRRLDSSVITSLIRLADKGEKKLGCRKKHVEKLHIIRTRLALKKVEKHLTTVFFIKKIELGINVFVQIFNFARTQLSI